MSNKSKIAGRLNTVIQEVKNSTIIFRSIFNDSSPEIPLRLNKSLKKFVDSLRKKTKPVGRYRERLNQKIDNNLPISLRVNKSWGDKFSEIVNIDLSDDSQNNQKLERIVNIFETSGRLLIVGNPGSGKTVLLLRLAMELLDSFTEIDFEIDSEFEVQKKQIPVIFNIASWEKTSANSNSINEWFLNTLNQGYGLSKKLAETLLANQRIIFLLDGLDELGKNENEIESANIKAKFLKLLNNYLTGNKKAVICCRTIEYQQIQSLKKTKAPVAAKIEVLKLTGEQVNYELKKAVKHKDTKYHASSKNILDEIKENSGLAKVVRVPFFYNISLTVFDIQNFEKPIPLKSYEIQKWLIDEYITKTLTTPNKKHFSKASNSKKWLELLAHKLKKKKGNNFELDDLQPSDLRRPWIFSILKGLHTTLYLLILLFFNYSVTYLIMFGIIIFVFIFLYSQLQIWVSLTDTTFKVIDKEQGFELKLDKIKLWKTWKSILLFFFICNILISFIVSINEYPNIDFYKETPIVLLLFGISLCFSVLLNVFSKKEFIYLHKPYQRLTKSTVFYLFAIGLPAIILITIAFTIIWVSSENKTSLVQFLSIISSFYLYYGFLLLFVISWSISTHAILRVCLFLDKKAPLKYKKFLDYTAEWRILEKDGGLWRFRHNYLLDYFFRLETTDSQLSNEKFETALANLPDMKTDNEEIDLSSFEDALEISKNNYIQEPDRHVLAYAFTLLKTSTFYINDRPDREKAIEFAVTALEILRPYIERDIHIQEYYVEALKILEFSGLDDIEIDNLIKER